MLLLIHQAAADKSEVLTNKELKWNSVKNNEKVTAATISAFHALFFGLWSFFMALPFWVNSGFAPCSVPSHLRHLVAYVIQSSRILGDRTDAHLGWVKTPLPLCPLRIMYAGTRHANSQAWWWECDGMGLLCYFRTCSTDGTTTSALYQKVLNDYIQPLLHALKHICVIHQDNDWKRTNKSKWLEKSFFYSLQLEREIFFLNVCLLFIDSKFLVD